MDGGDERGAGKPQYTLAGVIFFIQQEARRFEKERAEWAVDKALLMTKISQLEGEKVAAQNMNNDLLRRIKMLEYALKQERSKYVAGSGGSNLKEPAPTSSSPKFDSISVSLPKQPMLSSKASTSGKQQRSRQILQRYLTEMASIDSLVFPKQAIFNGGGELPPTLASFQSFQPSSTRDSMIFYRDFEGGNKGKLSVAPSEAPSADADKFFEDDIGDGKATIRPKEQQASSNLQQVFSQEKVKASEEPPVSRQPEEAAEEPEEPEEPREPEDKDEAAKEPAKQAAEGRSKSSEPPEEGEPEKPKPKEAATPADPEITEEQMEEMASKYNVPSGRIERMMKAYDKPKKGKKGSDKGRAKMPSFDLGGSSTDEGSGDKGKLSGLDELENLSVADEQDYKPAAESLQTQAKLPPKQWKPKSTLRGHLDSIRVVCFREQENTLLTASEDGTIKVWNTGALSTSKKQPEPEPYFTFRGHQSMILSMCVWDGKGGAATAYSGGADGSIRSWLIPPSGHSIFAPFDYKYTSTVVAENLDAVWALKAHPVRNLIASASSNSLVKLWSPETKKALITMEKATNANPTSLDFVHTDLKKMIVSYSNSACHLFDIETGKSITTLQPGESAGTGPDSQVNAVITHPTLPLAITGHEDKYIRFYDLGSGKCVNSMVAHLDAVSTVAINPNGLSLISGGHDSSIRVWDIGSYACTQEFTSHRKKYSEGVHSIAFHPNIPILASAGADAIAKVYT